MAKTVWLRNVRSCILELRMLKDYAGQPLVFTKPGTPMSRRCLTSDVAESDLVQKYVKQRILEEEGAVNKPAAAPTPERAPEPTPPPAPPAAPKADPEPETTPDPTPVFEPTPEPTPEPSEEDTQPTGRKRRKKRGS